MEERKNILDYLAQVFVIFGIMLLAISVICVLTGEEAAEKSTMFRLGSDGIPMETIYQYLLTSICVTGLRFLFFTDVLLKKMSVTGRTVGMLGTVVALIGVFSYAFGWFPVNEAEGWIAFLVCFGICFVISAGVSALKESMENRQLEDGLRNLKKKHNKEKQDETVH